MPSIFVALEGLDPWHLARHLDPERWRFASRDAMLAKGQVDVMLLDKQDAELHAVCTGLVSRVDCPAFESKVELHRLLQGTGTTPAAWIIGRWSVGGLYFDRSRRYLWRPGDGCEVDVRVVTNPEQLAEMRRDLEGDEHAVLSEYVERPLLLDGHKMTVRLYLIVATHRRGAALLTKGTLAVAPKPYVAGNWKDMAIHNTQASARHYPDDYPGDTDAFWALAGHQFNEALRVIRPRVKSCAKSEHGFAVLGCDLIVDATYNDVYLVAVEPPGRCDSRISDVVLTGVAQFALSLPTPGIPPVYERVGLVEDK